MKENILTHFTRLPCRVGHVPNPRRVVTRTRNDEPTVARKVERVDLLLVALEDVPDLLPSDVPDLQTESMNTRAGCHNRRAKQAAN